MAVEKLSIAKDVTEVSHVQRFPFCLHDEAI